MATTVKARGQITIVDLNDAKQVQTYIENDGADVQIYNPDTKVYTPNYATDPITLTAKVFVSGSADDQMGTENVVKASRKWYNGNTEITSSTPGFVLLDDNSKLKITGNISTNALQIKFEATYNDPDTQQDTQLMAFKTITKSASAGALFQAVVTTPSGYIFYNGSTQSSTLTAEVKVYRGGTQDTSGTTFTWSYLNISDGKWMPLKTGDSATTSGNVSTLTVKAANVLNFQTYKCVASDATDSGSNTAEVYVTFQDLSDPYRVEVYSESGDKIVNGADNTIIKARVWKGETIVEDASTAPASQKFTYTWTLFDRNGTKTKFHANATDTTPTLNSRTGNPLTLFAKDVQTRATVFCEISQ